MAESRDPELSAIEALISALEPLDDPARTRVLEYALRRMGISLSTGHREAQVKREPSGEQSGHAVRQMGGQIPATDIRSLKEQKEPKSANEMAAVVAYYLSELAPEPERKESVGTEDVEKYFKQAKYPLPKVPRVTLANATKAGYFDPVGGGQYALNPVGYNLVVHGLPRANAGSKGGTKRANKKPTRSKKPKMATKRKKS